MLTDSRAEFDLNVWADRWDREIEKWFQDPLGFWKCHPLFSCYNGSGKCEIKADYLPEPYLGDPCPSEGRHSAVFLNLNPGLPDNFFQAHPYGIYTARVRKVGYRNWAKNNPYNPLTNEDEKKTVYERAHEGGERFWGNRNRWLSEMTGHAKPSPPFCLEMFPFHSGRWGYYNESKAKDWTKEWVIRPAVALANHAEIPAVICVGKSFKRLFEDMGFIGSELVEFPVRWPMKASGKPLNRTFLRFKGLGGTFLVTYHSGGNKLPGPQFKEICLNILSQQ